MKPADSVASVRPVWESSQRASSSGLPGWRRYAGIPAFLFPSGASRFDTGALFQKLLIGLEPRHRSRPARKEGFVGDRDRPPARCVGIRDEQPRGKHRRDQLLCFRCWRDLLGRGAAPDRDSCLAAVGFEVHERGKNCVDCLIQSGAGSRPRYRFISFRGDHALDPAEFQIILPAQHSIAASRLAFVEFFEREFQQRKHLRIG